MEAMQIIYKMLRYLEKMMSVEEPDYTPIMPEALGIPRSLWLNVPEIMLDKGLTQEKPPVMLTVFFVCSCCV